MTIEEYDEPRNNKYHTHYELIFAIKKNYSIPSQLIAKNICINFIFSSHPFGPIKISTEFSFTSTMKKTLNGVLYESTVNTVCTSLQESPVFSSELP